MNVYELCSAIEDAAKVSKMSGMKEVLTSFLDELKEEVLKLPSIYVWYCKRTKHPFIGFNLSMTFFPDFELAQEMANKKLGDAVEVVQIDNKDYASFFKSIYETGILNVTFSVKPESGVRLDVREMFIENDADPDRLKQGKMLAAVCLLLQTYCLPDSNSGAYDSPRIMLQKAIIAHFIETPVYLPFIGEGHEKTYVSMKANEEKTVFPIFTSEKEAKPMVDNVPGLHLVKVPNSVSAIKAVNVALGVDKNVLGAVVNPFSVNFPVNEDFVKNCIVNFKNNNV